MFNKFKTLEGITSGFNEIIAALENLQSRNQEAVSVNERHIERLTQHNVELEAENQKASRFEANLRNLLGS